jgi:hypothetical protein
MVDQVLTHSYRDLGLALFPEYVCDLMLGRSLNVQTNSFAFWYNI